MEPGYRCSHPGFAPGAVGVPDPGLAPEADARTAGSDAPGCCLATARAALRRVLTHVLLPAPARRGKPRRFAEGFRPADANLGTLLKVFVRARGRPSTRTSLNWDFSERMGPCTRAWRENLQQSAEVCRRNPKTFSKPARFAHGCGPRGPGERGSTVKHGSRAAGALRITMGTGVAGALRIEAGLGTGAAGTGKQGYDENGRRGRRARSAQSRGGPQGICREMRAHSGTWQAWGACRQMRVARRGGVHGGMRCGASAPDKPVSIEVPHKKSPHRWGLLNTWSQQSDSNR